MSRIRREQVCARCRNHHINSILKGHKKLCPYLDCECSKCSETEIRRKFIAREIAFHRKNSKNFIIRKKPSEVLAKISKFKTNEASARYLCEVRRNQMCARCRNHGEDNLIRGHKNSCPYSSCECGKCEITKERRKIMAKQIKDYRTSKVGDENEPLVIDCQASASLDDNDSGFSGSSPEAETTAAPIFNEDEKPKTPVPDTFKVPEIPAVATRLSPEMLNTFFMVQSLYEKYCLNDTENKIQFVYAFVLLAHQNWSFVENALTSGLFYSEEFFKHHQQMASEHRSVVPQLQPNVRVKTMNGNF